MLFYGSTIPAVGFSLPDPLDAYGSLGKYGLLGMQERADLIGGPSAD